MAGLFFSETIILAAAPIMPDAKAEAHRHPQVMETASGIPLVNITAPTAGGVSMNDYERFNVPSKGAILNISISFPKHRPPAMCRETIIWPKAWQKSL